MARRLAGLLFGAAAIAALTIAFHAARGELRSLDPQRHPVVRIQGEAWLDGAKDVSLSTAKGVLLRGWLLGSRNGASIVLVHGARADRTQLLPEARILAGAGYGVLMFDLPGNGESGGQKRRGDDDDFVHVAVDALAAAPDVVDAEIGAYGFSTGAAILSEAAARDRRIRAVVLAGCYTDTTDTIRDDYRHWGPLSQWPALWAARWAGLVPLHPLAVVSAIAPRPLFFIAGDVDTNVPLIHAKRLYEAAAEPKDLWIVHGAGHGGYASVAGDEYTRRLVGFFDRALLGRAGSR